MADVAWFDSDDFGGHATPPGHPERQARWRAVQKALEPVRSYLQVSQAPLVGADALARVYSSAYVTALADLCWGSLDTAQAEAFGQPEIVRTTPLDADTFVGPHSWRAAQRAAGACVAAVRGVMQGTFEQAFCGVRPPGHHANAERAMGFCLLNNVALAAHEALHLGAQRVAILDWDVHHGNGTQDIFWSDPAVFYASIHQYPLYPGTGPADARGGDAGLGTTLNCPLPPGSGDDALLGAWSMRIMPALTAYRPDILLISAGFDADFRDPLSGLKVTAEGLAALSKSVLQWAQLTCGGRVVSALEGGYNLDSLSENVAAHVRHMLDAKRGALS